MNIPEWALNDLFQDLGEYNPITNEMMQKISIVLQPLGLAIVGVLFLTELSNYSKKFEGESGGLTNEVLLELGLKYLIATILIMSSGLIIDGILWFGIQMSKWINSVITVSPQTETIPPMEKAAWWQKPLVFLFQIFAYVALWLSVVIMEVLVFLRALQFYIVKAIAPILLAFSVSDELKSISMNFFKQVMALVLQGALLVLIVGLIPILTANDFLSFSSIDGSLWDSLKGVMQNILIYCSLILKYVVVIILLIGSQGMAKKFMGAM